MNVWQPNTAQWWMIWMVAVLLILCWPPDKGHSLAVSAAKWLADPANSLPTMPDPLPIGLDDNGDAVAAHDAQEAAYHQMAAGSRWTRLRMTMKNASDPLDPTTERQILTGIAVLGVLAIWQINTNKSRN